LDDEDDRDPFDDWNLAVVLFRLGNAVDQSVANVVSAANLSNYRRSAFPGAIPPARRPNGADEAWSFGR